MCNKLMPGVLNSGVCAGNIGTQELLAKDPHDLTHLIALIQHAVFASFEYDVNDERFQHMTPAAYKLMMKCALGDLERKIVAALDETFHEIEDNIPVVDGKKDETFYFTVHR